MREAVVPVVGGRRAGGRGRVVVRGVDVWVAAVGVGGGEAGCGGVVGGEVEARGGLHDFDRWGVRVLSFGCSLGGRRTGGSSDGMME